MDEQEKDTLYIPMGLKVKPEIFDGFGKEELFKSAGITIIAGLLDIVFYLVTKNVAVSVVMILASIAGSVMAFTKDKTNSVADQICNMVRFSKMQKQYPYKYLDEWSVLLWAYSAFQQCIKGSDRDSPGNKGHKKGGCHNTG